MDILGNLDDEIWLIWALMYFWAEVHAELLGDLDSDF